MLARAPRPDRATCLPEGEDRAAISHACGAEVRVPVEIVIVPSSHRYLSRLIRFADPNRRSSVYGFGSKLPKQQKQRTTASFGMTASAIGVLRFGYFVGSMAVLALCGGGGLHCPLEFQHGGLVDAEELRLRAV